jgi:hypothetical protein
MRLTTNTPVQINSMAELIDTNSKLGQILFFNIIMKLVSALTTASLLMKGIFKL